MAHYDIFRHHLAIKYPAYGHALWEPSPGELNPAVEVGDVGFIRDGGFQRLFNVLLPADDPSHENFGVPEDHQQLTLSMNTHINSSTLSPNNFCSAGVASESASKVLAMGPESPAEVAFSCRGKQGAVLSLPIQARCKNTVAQGDFGKWIIKHIDSWFAWARQRGLGIGRTEDIILVTGTHRTRSWTNVAFPRGTEDGQVSFGANVASQGNLVTINWTFSHERNRGAVLNFRPNGENLLEDQCIFIRGFRVSRKFVILPRGLKAAAGPNPDPKDDDYEPGVELTTIQAVPVYRDPLHILLEYITEEADCDMALVHDDDLTLLDLDGLGDDTSLETFQPEIMLRHLRRLKPKLHDFWNTASLRSFIMHQPLARPNSSNLNDLYPGQSDVPPEAFQPDTRPLRHLRSHSHSPSPQLQPQYDVDDDYATSADPRPSRLSRPSSQYLPPQSTPPPPQPWYPPQTRPQYIEDDGSPPPEDDDFYRSEEQLYRPAPGPSRSIATHSVRAHSPSPGPILDHSHLRPGKQAALLSSERTLELYRADAKKTQDPDKQFDYAVFMVDAYKTLPVPEITLGNVMDVEKAIEKREDLIKEATSLLKRNADRGHMPSQYFLADCYANGIGTHKNRQDFDRAFPLFILAAKHGHSYAAYRAGTCCENGWGCQRESAKAIQFYRKAAASSHPGALYRLGLAELNGELGMSKRPKEGVKWLKRSAEHANAEFPHALHELALLHERGIHNVVFVDYEYSAELLIQAAELGYAPSAYRLGECYEYGKMGCPQDPALSIHYYNIAAQQNHADACFALTAWYLVGSPGVIPQSDAEAFLWAKRAADAGLAKAMYAVGYFYEVAIGTPPNHHLASTMYEKAAKHGETRAAERLNGIVSGRVTTDSIVQRDGDGTGDKPRSKVNKDCIIM